MIKRTCHNRLQLIANEWKPPSWPSSVSWRLDFQEFVHRVRPASAPPQKRHVARAQPSALRTWASRFPKSLNHAVSLHREDLPEVRLENGLNGLVFFLAQNLPFRLSVGGDLNPLQV